MYCSSPVINLGDTLTNGSSVIGTLKLKGDKSNPYYKIWSRDLEDYIYVTGEHRILNNEESKAVFLSGGRGSAKEAINLLNIPIQTNTTLADASLDVLIEAITEKFGVLPYQEVVQLRENPDGARAQKIFDLYDVVQELANDIKQDG